MRSDDEQAPAAGEARAAGRTEGGPEPTGRTEGGHEPTGPTEGDPAPTGRPGAGTEPSDHAGTDAGTDAEHTETRSTGREPGAQRSETPTERSDRNWDELMQELRVTQTGIQILTAFLLTLPFQPRFAELSAFQQGMYLVLVVLAVTTTALLVAPVSLHRRLFQRRRKPQLVQTANTLAQVGLLTFALVITGTAAFVFEMVLGPPATWVAAGAAAAMLCGLWLALPWRLGRRPRPELPPQ